jgi:hypothetical protein
MHVPYSLSVCFGKLRNECEHWFDLVVCIRVRADKKLSVFNIKLHALDMQQFAGIL